MEPKSAKWRQISATRQLNFTGGFQNKQWPLESKDVETFDGAASFVKIDKKLIWLHKAIAGDKAGRETLRRSTLFDELRQKLCEASCAPEPASRGSAGSGAR